MADRRYPLLPGKRRQYTDGVNFTGGPFDAAIRNVSQS